MSGNADLLSLIEDLEGVKGRLYGYYDAKGDFIDNEEEALSVRAKLYPLLDSIEETVENNPDLLRDESLLKKLIEAPFRSVSSGQSSMVWSFSKCLKSYISIFKDPEERKNEIVSLFHTMIDVKETEGGSLILDPKDPPRRLSETQEGLVCLVMHTFLSQNSSAADVDKLKEVWKNSTRGSLAEEMPTRRLWNLGNWLTAVGQNTGRSCGVGRSLAVDVERINTLLAEKSSDLRVLWPSTPHNVTVRFEP